MVGCGSQRALGFKPHHWLLDPSLPLPLFLEPPKAVPRITGMCSLVSNPSSGNAAPSLHETAALGSEHLWCVCRGDRTSHQGETGPCIFHPGDPEKEISVWRPHRPYLQWERTESHPQLPTCRDLSKLPILPDAQGVHSSTHHHKAKGYLPRGEERRGKELKEGGEAVFCSRPCFSPSPKEHTPSGRHLSATPQVPQKSQIS